MSSPRPDHITLNHEGLTCRRCGGHAAVQLPLAPGELAAAIREHVQPFIEKHGQCLPTFTVGGRAA